MPRTDIIKHLLLPGLLLLFLGQSLLLWHQLDDTLAGNADQCEICLLAGGGSTPASAPAPIGPPDFFLATPIRITPVLRPASFRFLRPSGRAPPFFLPFA